MRKIAFLILMATASFGYEAKVVKIVDGDTIKILKNNNQISVRLYGIDAPEKRQDFGRVSKKALSNKIALKNVQIKEFGKDRYKRTIAKVYLNDEDICKFMVENGYAWAFIKYSKDYAIDEKYARENRLGLWKDKAPISPWEWRKKLN